MPSPYYIDLTPVTCKTRQSGVTVGVGRMPSVHIGHWPLANDVMHFVNLKRQLTIESPGDGREDRFYTQLQGSEMSETISLKMGV